jgi:hypothetical protein
MRGSRPGERRGGRQKGTPNKKTALDRAAIAALGDNKNLEPLDLMLAVTWDPHVSLATRVKMALRALPLLHTKLKADQLGSSAAAGSGTAAQSVHRPNESEGGNAKSAAATSREAKLGASKSGAGAQSSDRLAVIAAVRRTQRRPTAKVPPKQRTTALHQWPISAQSLPAAMANARRQRPRAKQPPM